MALSANQTRAALALLDWAPLTLAARAFLALDDVAKAQDDITIRHLGGLQLGAVREALKAAGIEFIFEAEGAAGVRLRKST